MINNNIIQNPYSTLLPQTLNINNDIIRQATPKGLHNLYKLGMLNGVILDTDITPYPYKEFARYNFHFLRDNQKDGQSIIFEDTKYYSQIRDSGKGKRVNHAINYLRIDPNKAGKSRQVTGDCVSMAIRNALDQLRCNKIVNGAWEAYIARQATCGIYSGRGHTGQGADPVGLSDYAIEIGTILEIIYETSKGKYDFKDYDTYVEWGMSRGRVGVPQDLLEQTKPYTAGGYKIVATTDALLDLMVNGQTAHCGSNLGFASYGNPIHKRSGSWSHDMNLSMADDTDECKEKFGSRVFAFEQEWGNWCTTENVPDFWKPYCQGTFFVLDKDLQRGVDEGGTVTFLEGKWFNAEPITNKII